MYKLFTDSPYQRYGESATPRITDTGSRYLKKKISLALIFRTFAAESVNILYIHDVEFLFEFSHLRYLEKFFIIM
jgi:hypothetical protein